MAIKRRGSQKESTTMSLLAVHGVKGIKTRIALVISRTLFPGSSGVGEFRTCSCRMRPEIGRAMGGAAPLATAHVQIRQLQLQGKYLGEMLAKGR